MPFGFIITAITEKISGTDWTLLLIANQLNEDLRVEHHLNNTLVKSATS